MDVQALFRKFDQIESVTARSEKERILRSIKDVKVFGLIMDVALNPFRVYGVDDIPELPKEERLSKKWDDTTFCKKLVVLAESFEKSNDRTAKLARIRELMRHGGARQRKWAQRILLKNLRMGVDTKTINKVFKDRIHIPTFTVQLAKPIKEVSKLTEALASHRWAIEPKLNGLRLLLDGRTPYSREGKPLYNLEHIIEQVRSIKALDDYVIDGELMEPTPDPDHTWRKSVSIARSSVNKKDNSKLIYFIFDAIPKHGWDPTGDSGPCAVSWLIRRHVLEEAIGHVDMPNFVLNPYEEMQNPDHLYQTYEELVAAEFEGAMLKRMDAFYSYKRNAEWIKIKPEESEDLEIVSFNEGEGRLHGTLGSFVIVRKGVETSVSGLTDKQRDYIWTHRDELIGTIAEVKYQMLSPDKKLLFPRFVRLRPDKQ